MLTETLTVTIAADSSALESELTRLSARVASFTSELAQIGGSAAAAADAIAAIGKASSPVQRLSGIVTGLRSQLAAIAATPLQLDVSPAIASLQHVIATAAQAAAAVQLVGSGPSVSTSTSGPFQRPPSGGGGSAFGAGPPVPRLATGGRVEGPAGLDTVPTLLTRGEFVLREPAARKFPSGMLDQLNAVGPAALPPASQPAVASAASPAAPTHGGDFGGESAPVQLLGDITVQVTQPMELDDVLGQLELGRMRQTNRAG